MKIRLRELVQRIYDCPDVMFVINGEDPDLAIDICDVLGIDPTTGE